MESLAWRLARRQCCGGLWWRSLRDPVIQAGKYARRLVSEKEIQKKEEGMLYSSELDSEGWAGHRAEPLGAATSR